MFKKRLYRYRQLSLERRWQRTILTEVCKIKKMSMKLLSFAAFPISEMEASRETTMQQVQKKQEVLLAYSTMGYYKS